MAGAMSESLVSPNRKCFLSRREEFVDAIYLFGSRLRGTFHEGSDLDLAILLSLKPSPDPERPYWRFNHERVDRELQELIPVETDVTMLHLTDWDDTTEYVRKEGLAIYVNPTPDPARLMPEVIYGHRPTLKGVNGTYLRRCGSFSGGIG